MPDWGWWLLAALVLVGVEILTLDLVFAMLAAGALAAGVTALLGGPPLAQVLIGSGVAVLMLAAVRPVALRHLRQTPQTRTGVAALVGRQGVVVETVDRDTGRIKLAGEIWSATPYEPGQRIDVGRTVDVVRIDGATAVVLQADIDLP
jgi:membrane protein implicated in regulation of membrane protease activity